MAFISPWGMSVGMYASHESVPVEIYTAALTAGSWVSSWNSPVGGHPLYRAGEYQPGWANRFFNNDSPSQKPSQSREYDQHPGVRAQKYVDAALSQKWNPQLQKWEKAGASDAYTTTQHSARSEADLREGTEGRDDEMIWLADSMTDWMKNDQKRMDYFHAVAEMNGSPHGAGVRGALANLIVPGSTGATDDVARVLSNRLKPSEMPSGEKTTDALMNAYLDKLGGEAAVQQWLYPMLDAVHRQASARGGYDTPKSAADFRSDLQKKGLSPDEAQVILDTVLAGKNEYTSRKVVEEFSDLNKLPHVIGAEEKKRKRFEQLCVAGLKALGVEDQDQISKYYAQIQKKIQQAAASAVPVYDFSKLMQEAKRLIDAGTAPTEEATQGGAATPASSAAPGAAVQGAPATGGARPGGRGRGRGSAQPSTAQMQRLQAISTKARAGQSLTASERRFVTDMQRRYPQVFAPTPAAAPASPAVPTPAPPAASGGGLGNFLLNGARRFLGF